MKIRNLGLLGALLVTLMLQACGSAINFTPLTKEQVQKLKDAGDKFTDETATILTDFVKNVDLKACVDAYIQDKLVRAQGDSKREFEKALENLKKEKDTAALLSKIDEAHKKIDSANHATHSPESSYKIMLVRIAQWGAMISKNTVAEELAKVQSEAKVELTDKDGKLKAIEHSYDFLESVVGAIYRELTK